MIALMLALVVATGGATLDRSGFLYERPVPKAKGLVSLQLDADVLARSNNSLSDVRIVNAQNEQVPYIVQSLPNLMIVPLPVSARATEGSSSLYRITLPYESLPTGSALELTTTARVFERRTTLRLPADEQRGREATILTEISWSGMNPEVPPSPLMFDVSHTEARTVELLIDEGDNAPLPIASVRLTMPAYAIRFYHPGTSLTLLYGNASIGAPRYDLALLAKQIATEKAQPLTLTSAPPPAARRTPSDSKRWFWAVLLFAVATLLSLLSRLISSR